MGFLFGRKKKNVSRKDPERLAMEQKWAEDRIKSSPCLVKAAKRVPNGPDDAEVQAITRSMQIAYYGMYKKALSLRRFFRESVKEFSYSEGEFHYNFFNAVYSTYEHIMKNGNYLYLAPVDPGTKPECIGKEYLELLKKEVGHWKPFDFKDSTGFVYKHIDPLTLTEDHFYYFRDVLVPYMVKIGIESPKYYEELKSRDMFSDWKLYEEGVTLDPGAIKEAVDFFQNKIVHLPFMGSVPLFFRWGYRKSDNTSGEKVSPPEEKRDVLQYCTAYSVDDIANIMYQVAEQIPAGRFTFISSAGIPEYDNLNLEEHHKIFACNLFTTITAKCLEPNKDEQGYPIQSGRVIDYKLEYITDSKHVQVRVGAPIEEYKEAVVRLLSSERMDGSMAWDSTYGAVFVGNDEPSVFEQIDNCVKQWRINRARALEEKARALRDFSQDDY